MAPKPVNEEESAAISNEQFEEDPISSLQQELGEARRRGQKEREIDLLLAIANRSHLMEDLALESLHLDIAAKQIRKSSKRSEILHDVLGKLALIMRQAKRFDRALLLYQEAEKAATQYNGIAEAALWKGKQGNIYRLQNQLDLARECYEESLQKFESIAEAGYSGVAEQEGCLGLVEQALGNFDEVLDHYRRAVEFAAKSGNISAICTWNENYGNELTRRKLYTRAWESYGRAFELLEPASDESPLHDLSLSWSGSYAAAHRRDLSAALLQSTAKKVKDPHYQLSLLQSALLDLQILDRREELAATLAVTEALTENLGVRDNTTANARAYLKRNSLAKPARRERKLAGREPTVLEVFATENMAAAEQSGNVDGMMQVADLLCDINSGLPVPSDEEWQRYLPNHHLRYRIVGDVLHALFQADRFRESLDLSQRFKGAGFAVLTLRSLEKQNDLPEVAQTFLGAHRDLSEKIKLLSQPASSVAVPLPLIETVRAAGERLLEAGALLREQDRDLHARLGGTILRSDLTDALPPTEGVAICDVFVGYHGTLIHILLRDTQGVTLIPYFAATFSFNECGDAFKLLLEHHVYHELSPRQRDGLLQIGKLLHDHLICNLSKETYKYHITQFIFVPGPYLQSQPLGPTLICAEQMPIPGVTRGGEDFFGEVYPFEFAPCLQAIAVSQHQKRPRNIEKVVSIADPGGDLPGARFTARNLERTSFKKLDCVSLMGAQATANAFFEHTRDANVIVLGTHGALKLSDPGASFIRLHDRTVTLEEIVANCQFRKSPVVILSACEIGALVPGGDPTLGLIPGALIAAGAATVIASSWPVVDVPTGFLVERLLHYLAHPGYRPAAALFRALRDLRQWPKADALRYCSRLMRQMEKDGSADRLPLEYLQVDQLRDLVRKMNHPNPFSGPEMWGGFAAYGSGWSAPAGAVVGVKIQQIVQSEQDKESIKQLLADKDFDAALALTDKTLFVAQGADRARALEWKALAVWADGTRANHESSQAEALDLLQQAIFTAEAEQDEQLLRNLRATREKILL